MAEQRASLITLGSRDLHASRRFYCEGFCWTPAFQNEEIIFYQLNGWLLATFAERALEDDMQRSALCRPGSFAMAHNVRREDEVGPLIDALVAAGGTLLRSPDRPPIGGLRGYVADPDDHAWEIAYNPAFKIDADGNLLFGV